LLLNLFIQNTITITPADPKCKEAIIALLQSEKLPVEDLPVNLQNFFVAMDNGFVIGAIGLEVYDKDGLLRSLVVKSEYRKMKIAQGLIGEIEKFGTRLGLKNIYLLTETAQIYFIRKEYQVIERKEVPELLKQSSEFTYACPASATLMKKSL